MNYRAARVLLLIIFFALPGCAHLLLSGERSYESVLTDRDSIAMEMRGTLDSEFDRWYPASIDGKDGGFLSDFDYAWRAEGAQTKMIVTQSRHVWSASNAAQFYENKAPMRAVALHGVAYLQHTMWDARYGGYYELVDRQGNPIGQNGELVKTAYGNAFAIYGLAACAEAFHDTSALRMAQDAFRWLEVHSYDPLYGGYFQFLSRDGVPFTEGYRGTPPKDYNSLIHILEAYTQLHRVWNAPIVKERLTSLFHLIRDTVAVEKGYLALYFNRDWTPGAGMQTTEMNHVSFGHDVETAYLLLEASAALGMKNDTVTLRIAKRMVDHAIENGWDEEHGGLYDEGSYRNGGAHAEIIKRTKEWWAQVEAFNAFLMMSDLFPNDAHRYYAKFYDQWHYCMKYLIDHEHGGWYWGGTDIVPDNIHSPKGSIWKGNYHTSRALINCIARLKKSNGEAKYSPVSEHP